MQSDPSIMQKYNLSSREMEVASLIMEGHDNRTIAEKLFISVATVKSHVYNIFKKTETRNRFELFSLMQSGVSAGPKQPTERGLSQIRLIPSRFRVGMIVVIMVVLIITATFLSRSTITPVQSEIANRSVYYHEADLLQNCQSIPQGLGPLTVAKCFFYLGHVQKNQELWRQLLSRDGWTEAQLTSTWRILAEVDMGGKREYEFLRLAEDGPARKKFFFQRRVNGEKHGIPRPIIVVREDGEWRVEHASP